MGSVRLRVRWSAPRAVPITIEFAATAELVIRVGVVELTGGGGSGGGNICPLVVVAATPLPPTAPALLLLQLPLLLLLLLLAVIEVLERAMGPAGRLLLPLFVLVILCTWLR